MAPISVIPTLVLLAIAGVLWLASRGRVRAGKPDATSTNDLVIVALIPSIGVLASFGISLGFDLKSGADKVAGWEIIVLTIVSTVGGSYLLARAITAKTTGTATWPYDPTVDGDPTMRRRARQYLQRVKWEPNYTMLPKLAEDADRRAQAVWTAPLNVWTQFVCGLRAFVCGYRVLAALVAALLVVTAILAVIALNDDHHWLDYVAAVLVIWTPAVAILALAGVWAAYLLVYTDRRGLYARIEALSSVATRTQSTRTSS